MEQGMEPVEAVVSGQRPRNATQMATMEQSWNLATMDQPSVCSGGRVGCKEARGTRASTGV